MAFEINILQVLETVKYARVESTNVFPFLPDDAWIVSVFWPKHFSVLRFFIGELNSNYSLLIYPEQLINQSVTATTNI